MFNNGASPKPDNTIYFYLIFAFIQIDSLDLLVNEKAQS